MGKAPLQTDQRQATVCKVIRQEDVRREIRTTTTKREAHRFTTHGTGLAVKVPLDDVLGEEEVEVERVNLPRVHGHPHHLLDEIVPALPFLVALVPQFAAHQQKPLPPHVVHLVHHHIHHPKERQAAAAALETVDVRPHATLDHTLLPHEGETTPDLDQTVTATTATTTTDPLDHDLLGRHEDALRLATFEAVVAGRPLAVEVVGVAVVVDNDPTPDHLRAIRANTDLVVEVAVVWRPLRPEDLALEEEVEEEVMVIVAHPLHEEEADSETEEEEETEGGVHHLREEEVHEVALDHR